jgi:hypothetical protein
MLVLVLRDTDSKRTETVQLALVKAGKILFTCTCPVQLWAYLAFCTKIVYIFSPF